MAWSLYSRWTESHNNSRKTSTPVSICGAAGSVIRADFSVQHNAQPGFHTRRRQAGFAGVAGGCAGALEAIRACHRVTRANHRGGANHTVRYKHHLRDARKRPGADARRAGQCIGVASTGKRGASFPSANRKPGQPQVESPNADASASSPRRLKTLTL